VLKDIDSKVSERTQRLEDIIRSRGKKEKIVSGFLTIVALLLVLVLYTKTQKGGGKRAFPGGMGGQAYGYGAAGSTDNYVI